MRTALVIGGTGMLGVPVVRGLVVQGWAVRVLSRRSDVARTTLGTDVEVVDGDVEDAAVLARAVAGCEVVHVNLRDARDPGLEQRAAVAVAAAAARAEVRRISYLSGATVCAENAWFAWTRGKLDAEAALIAGAVPHTILRAASFMEALPQYVRGRSAIMVGRGRIPWHWLAADDYAAMVCRAYEVPESADTVLHVHGPQALSLRDALAHYLDVARPGTPMRTMPLWLAGSVARLFRIRDLAEGLPYLRYLDRTTEAGDPEQANGLLGTPMTTLEEWSLAMAASTRG